MRFKELISEKNKFNVGDKIYLTDKKIKNSLEILYGKGIEPGEILDLNVNDMYPISIKWKTGGITNHKENELKSK